jgi:hypothetical protein
LEYAFIDIFGKNQIELKRKNVFKEVQKALAKCPTAEVLKKESPTMATLASLSTPRVRDSAIERLK